LKAAAFKMGAGYYNLRQQMESGNPCRGYRNNLECAVLTALWIRWPRKNQEIQSAVKPAHSKFPACGLGWGLSHRL